MEAISEQAELSISPISELENGMLLHILSRCATDDTKDDQDYIDDTAM